MHHPTFRVMMTTMNLDFGGVEQMLLTYARHMSRDRHEIVVACTNPGHIAREIASLTGVRLVHIDSRFPLARFFHFLRIAREFKPQIVHNHACWYGLLIGRIVGAQCVETVHNTYSWFRFRERVLYGFYCLLAHRMIACSNFVKQFTMDHFPFMNPGKFITIHYGVNIEQFALPSTRDTLVRSLGIDDRAMLVGFVGRLVHEKGVQFLLEAATRLAELRPDVRFIIVGDGPSRKQLEAVAHQQQLHNVHFVGRSGEIPRFLSAFDVYVLPSLLEGFPIGILEALASGLPVIASRVSGIPEAIRPGENGLLIEPGDIDKLTEHIVYLADHPEIRTTMGARARKIATEEFSDHLMVEKTVALYRELSEL